MSACPKCGSEIADATYCGCGWKKPKTKSEGPRSEPRTPCAFYSCARLSVVKIQTIGNSWANFCEEHYASHFQAQAEETCKKLGLKTREQKYQWVREKLKAGLFKRVPVEPIVEREPGEDREEMEMYVQA